MLCEISDYVGGSLFGIWMSMNIITFIFIFGTSAPVFYFYYWPSKVTYQKWIYKTNPSFPPVEKVRDEIFQMMKGMLCATICPAVSLYLAQDNNPSGRKISQAFCGWGDMSLAGHFATFMAVWIASDFYEFSYHRLGHVDFRFWKQHKHHHVFYNPSPFSVIADEWVDQFLRSAPLLIIPILIPVNMDMLFIQYGLFFYVYGVYLHWGYELPELSAHNPIINTSYQHHCHHAKSSMNRPFHCGFFFKLWDQLFDCIYPNENCFCAECCRAKGERTVDEFNKISLPDYSQLLNSKIWIQLFTDAKIKST